MIELIISNLEKVGLGVLLFLGAYASNMLLGAWRSVKIEGFEFEWGKIASSLAKFIVLGVGIGLMSIIVSILPFYMTYVGIDIGEETMQIFDSIVIISAFTTAAIKYVKDAYTKLKDILSV